MPWAKKQTPYEKLQGTAKVEACWERERSQGVQRPGWGRKTQSADTAPGTTPHTTHRHRRGNRKAAEPWHSMPTTNSKWSPAPNKRNPNDSSESLSAPVSRHIDDCSIQHVWFWKIIIRQTKSIEKNQKHHTPKRQSNHQNKTQRDFPTSPVVKIQYSNCRRHGFNPWSGH